LKTAREAVASDFARRGVEVAASSIVLTASTSEAYSLLFKLLCDPGNVVLVPRPSYPLLEHLAVLDSVALDHYPLEYQDGWRLDLDALRFRLRATDSAPVRAVVLVTPNNPTGSVATVAELAAVAALARDHEVALVSDEVFADYPLSIPACGSALSQREALTFTLGGLSKSIGLPQVKLGWIGVSGPERLVSDAMERLETICDTYLSVSTPVQAAARDLMQAGASVRYQILERVRANLERLLAEATAFPSCSVLKVEAGWYAVLQVPRIGSEEAIVLDLLDTTGVLVHPGYFYDFDREAFLVVSLLPETAVFAWAVRALFSRIGGRR
jgi:aspartate/methionine/tyrosine aminotransferase